MITLITGVPGSGVSTHSRPKAAGFDWLARIGWNTRFNTQPPEGGWPRQFGGFRSEIGFNTQPPEGGWLKFRRPLFLRNCFNTQPPEGGWMQKTACRLIHIKFQHTAARRRLAVGLGSCLFGFSVSTHSRPKAAGLSNRTDEEHIVGFQHTAARRRLVPHFFGFFLHLMFQHTAARRRLDYKNLDFVQIVSVSTHSRPKAAGVIHLIIMMMVVSFNTQPPEGGWIIKIWILFKSYLFQHTAARRRLAIYGTDIQKANLFQHTAARRRLDMCFQHYPFIFMFQHTAARRRLDAGRTVNGIYAMFQHTAARRRLGNSSFHQALPVLFQHTAARRRLVQNRRFAGIPKKFQHTAARRRLAAAIKPLIYTLTVSTHSRPKAAGACASVLNAGLVSFQHTAARRRLEKDVLLIRP